MTIFELFLRLACLFLRCQASLFSIVLRRFIRSFRTDRLLTFFRYTIIQNPHIRYKITSEHVRPAIPCSVFLPLHRKRLVPSLYNPDQGDDTSFLFSFVSLFFGKWPLDPIVSASDFALWFPILPKDDAFDLMFSEIASDLFSGSKRTVNDLFSMRY